MLNKIITQISDIVLGILVTVYIVLEELIWDNIAEPIYAFIHDLKILQKAEAYIDKLNRHILLTLFVILFVQVELLGIYALKLIGTGKIIAGTTLYAGKIPVAAFTFWLFRVSKVKLMTFDWFKQTYDLLILIIEKIKSSQIHQRIAARLGSMKIWLKNRFAPTLHHLRKSLESLKKSTHLDKIN